MSLHELSNDDAMSDSDRSCDNEISCEENEVSATSATSALASRCVSHEEILDRLPLTYRGNLALRLLVTALSAFLVGMVGTFAHRMGASSNIPYGLVLGFVILGLSAWSARMRAGYAGLSVHVVVSYWVIWHLAAHYGPQLSLLTPIGFGQESGLPFFSIYAGYSWLYGSLVLHVLIFILPQRFCTMIVASKAVRKARSQGVSIEHNPDNIDETIVYAASRGTANILERTQGSITQTDTPEEILQSDEQAQVEQPDQVDQDHESEQSVQSGQLVQSEQSVYSEQSVQSEQSLYSGQPIQTEHTHHVPQIEHVQLMQHVSAARPIEQDIQQHLLPLHSDQQEELSALQSGNPSQIDTPSDQPEQ